MNYFCSFFKSSSYVPHIPICCDGAKKNLFSKYMCEMKELTELFYWAEDDGIEEISTNVFSSGPDINTATTEEEDGENKNSNGWIRSEVAGSALALALRLPPLIQSIGGGARVLLLSMMIW